MNSIAPITDRMSKPYGTDTIDATENCAPALEMDEAAPLPFQGPPAALNYQQLVQQAQSGDSGAFDALIRRHHGECMKRAMHVMRNVSDAKDQVQNAYCKALTSIGQFRGEGTFGAWLTRIVENQCLMTFRRSRVRFLRLDTRSESNVQIELISQDVNPEDRLGSEEVTHVLRSEIRMLPPIMRDIVRLYDLGGLSLPEVASQLGISVPAAKSRLSRARLELRSRIAKHLGKKGPASLTQRAVSGRTAYGSRAA